MRKQVAVLAPNILAARLGRPLGHYDGYTVMPITTARHRLMLVEVDRDGRPQPTVPFPDLTVPRAVTWWADRGVVPRSTGVASCAAASDSLPLARLTRRPRGPRPCR